MIHFFIEIPNLWAWVDNFWHSCLLMDLSGPSIDMRSRVHQKTWGFWVHQKTWGFRRGKKSEKWVFGSIKKHEVSRGEGSIKRHEVFGSIKRHEISLRETQKLVHQSTWGLKFCYQCTSGFIDYDNCSKSGHWGCGREAPFRFREHCLVLGFG